MRKTISVVALAVVLGGGSAHASGWRIPEQSLDSMSKAAANIASANGPDASYYNPANMAWLQDRWQVEGTLTYLHLTAIEYEDNRSSLYNGASEKENFLLPTLFLVSPEYSGFRFGFSITEPYGLSKRWQDDPFPRTYAQDFTVKVFEFNPTVAYRVNDVLSFAGGVRLLYNEATVEQNGVIDPTTGLAITRKVDGDTVEWGYNLALALKPTPNWNLSATYRSHVDQDFEGDVLLYTTAGPTRIDTTGSVTVPAPAVLSLSVAYTWQDLTVDFTWDRTFWSEYEYLDFNYAVPVTNPVLYAAFDRPIAKQWDDASAYRIGFEYRIGGHVTLMAGFAYDETPVPDDSLGFELPDSDAFLYSLGVRYAVNEDLEIGIGGLYDYKEERTVTNNTVNGTFTDASAFLVSCGLTYRF